MKKVYIVMDEPESCAECQFYMEYMSCFLEHVSFGEDEKPKDCPLKPLPEKQTLDLATCNALNFSEKDMDMARGWNACIDRILEDEDG